MDELPKHYVNESYVQKTYFRLPCIRKCPKQASPSETVEQMTGCLGVGMVAEHRRQRELWEDGNILKLGCSDGYSTPQIY